MIDEKLIKRIANIKILTNPGTNVKEGVPLDFLPWDIDLSPSALYSCSINCRKAMGIKTPEVKWVSVKRWVNITTMGVQLPQGCYLSIKRCETFEPFPSPKFKKQDFVLVMFPYGNVWSQKEPGVPITEEWLWSTENGKTIFELLLEKDAMRPINGYFKSCYKYMLKNPGQVGIHLKRKKNLTKVVIDQ